MASRGGSARVEQELWNIFTYYTIHGKSQNPELM